MFYEPRPSLATVLRAPNRSIFGTAHHLTTVLEAQSSYSYFTIPSSLQCSYIIVCHLNPLSNVPVLSNKNLNNVPLPAGKIT